MIARGYIGGLEDSSVEIFVNQANELKATYKSRCITFNVLPLRVRDILSDFMDNDTEAVKSLRRDFGLTAKADQLIQYARCNFPGLDGIADLTESGEVHREIHDCHNRDNCKAAFKVCAPISGKEGTLTKKEAKVLFLVCNGMLDKEIGQATNTTISTVETQLRNIRHKLAINNRVEIILFAVKNNISF